ncbi:MAG TPA: ribosome biogenesis GTPase Der [Terriglobales bacterium]|jgi:GTP-binding protein|nr:ribosome biogenesis GTPase Der [Terriglobales bacterium]
MTSPTQTAVKPFTLAIVGRPNVGKSTLFNRLTGSRRAIVGDEPGITRDRLYAEAEWRGRPFRIVDTGGIIPDDEAFIPSEIFRQARVALDEAGAVVMVVDGRTELAAPDLELARLLNRTGKPVFLAVNKIDTEKQRSLIGEFHRLGLRNVFPVSAENGNGLDDLVDAVFAAVPAEAAPEATEEEISEEPPSEEATAAEPEKEIKVAIIGHPNVGKSTLLNRLTAADRSIVSPIPGTTRDAVDELVERDGRKFRFIDTAGIRRKGKTSLMAEKLSVVMARKHLEDADIALMVIDATEGVSQIDATIAGYAHESGRSVIIIVNKWDLILKGGNQASNQSKAARMRESKRPGDQEAYEYHLRDALKFLSYAPLLFISASEGKGTEKIFAVLEQVASERRKRITTSEMNRFLKFVDFERATVPLKSRVRIYYMTQASVSPPVFVIFTDKKVKLHFSYERFLENQIRKAFGFVGTPIWIKMRASE